MALHGDDGHVIVKNPQENGAPWISFSSNDYLGLAHDARVVEAACRGIERYGVGSGSSRLMAGTHPAHAGLEEALAEFKGVEAALTFATGYATAAGLATAFLDKASIVLLDKLCHACLIDACRLSGATVRGFRHNDLNKLAFLLRWARRQRPRGRVVVMTESVFSMDGDAAPLEEIVDLKERYGAQLLLDEAHAIGVLGPAGRGLAAACGLTDRVDFHLGTLGKALGTAGGYLAGSKAMIEVLLNRARSFIYSTAPPAALAEAARTSLALVSGDEGHGRRIHLRSLMEHLARKLGAPQPIAAILPVIIGGESDALGQAAALRQAGFYVPAIRYPSVARGAARLRITVSVAHTKAQIDALTQAMAAHEDKRGPGPRSTC